MVAASLACLCCGGSFAEVGKRDIWSPARVAQVRELHQLCCGAASQPSSHKGALTPALLGGSSAGQGLDSILGSVKVSKWALNSRHAQERPDLRYCLVAVDFLLAAVIRASMLRLGAEFARGALPSLPWHSRACDST